MALMSCSAWAQNLPQSGASSPPVNARGMEGDHERDAPSISPQMQEQMADRRNSERQRQLIADTEKLFFLAQQLRDEVAKSNKDQLSVPVVKKSEEIEKLAKTVKEKMRGY
jgi:type VI protein secretion system component VasF